MVFAQDYAQAREGFVAAAARRGLKAQSALHPSRKGAKGEDLAMDSVLLGPADAASLLIVTSGTHGVEGFCGSGCQRALLGDDELLKRFDAAKLAARERMGHREFQAAVSAGQGSHPDGLFFSGIAPSWSNLTSRALAAGTAPT